MKRKIKIQQHDSYDCGAACLASVAAWYGLYLPLAKIRRLCGCTKEGITIKGIMDGAEKIGLKSEAYMCEGKELYDIKDSITLPAIAHTRQENGFFHFVNIIGIDKRQIEVMEPSCGELKKIPYNRFIAEWTGYLITLSPSVNFKQGNNRRGVYRRLFSLLYSTKGELVHSLIGSAMIVLIGVANPLFLQYLIDTIIPAQNGYMLPYLSGCIIALTLFMLFISYGRNIYLAFQGMKIDNLLINGYIGKVFSLPVCYFNQYSAGDLNSRVSDAFNIRLFISEGVISVLISVITVSASLIIIFKFNSTLAFLSLSFIPIYFGLYLLCNYINKRYNRKLAVNGARFETDMLQGMDSIIGIRHYNAQNLSVNRIRRSYDTLALNILDSSVAVTILGVLSDALSKGFTAATLILGTFMIFNNSLSVGELVAFYSLCTFFTAPLNSLTRINGTISQALVSSERLFEIMDLEEVTQIEPGSKPIGRSWQSINICNLCFAYPGREKLFNGLDLEIERGSITAINGDSGCGKSTLAALLMRDFEPDKGNIYLDNDPISSFSLEEWHHFISTVHQLSFFFNATLLENITCGQESPDTERVIDICNAVGLAGLIQRLPMGLLTTIGENGSALSGGEMQKMAIARAVYRNPQILVLDESTSSLDKESEELILKYIAGLSKEGKTILLITHNSNVLKYAHKVINI